MNRQKLLVCFAVAFIVFGSACATRRSPDVKHPPTPELPKITIGTCVDFYGMMGLPPNDAWNVYDSKGLPDNCRYIHSHSVELNILSPSVNLQSSKCWNGRSFVFDEGPSIMIFYYYETNSVFVHADMKDVADFSRQNFTERGRDQALLDICPPNVGQVRGPWPGNWHLLNFRADQGSDYETILYNIFGAGGGGVGGSRTGTEGMDATHDAQSVEEFEFRNIALDTEIIQRVEEHNIPFNELRDYGRPVVYALREKESILRVARDAAAARGNKKEKERLEKELKNVEKELSHYLGPIIQAEEAIEDWKFAGISVESPIKSFTDMFPVKIDSLLNLGIESIEIGGEVFDLKKLKSEKVEFVPHTEREPLLAIAKRRSDTAVKLQEVADMKKRELEKKYRPETFAEPNMRPGNPILMLMSVTGPKHTRDDKTRLKVRLRMEFYPADEKDAVDMNAPPITDKEVVIFKLDDLIAGGFTMHRLSNGETVDFVEMKNAGRIWSPPIFFQKQGAESILPREEGEYLKNFEFLSDESGHDERLTAIHLAFFTERMLRGNIPCVLAPGVYKIHLTLIDELRNTDDKKKEIELPVFTFRIMYPRTDN